ncbi:DNA polymerase I [Taibaiella chishuiensis]|uniref:DNA polymerase I n=1 Tax=Taibaiella chishuiensis TaxID=1434707 RepID=A0A2P8D421_9BACT|nr:DNA polymerase I [Taibaiella chishuiensis]PSK91978.1 DNA polymerase I [Taibaiella chishuiensis]
MSDNNKKLFLLDAMALVYRAYYALIRSPRVTSLGRNTNAQFGFTNTLNDLIQKEKPTHMAVVWDTHAPTERHTDFTDYKANRQEAPEDLLDAIPDIKRIVKGFNIPCLELDGYEADDIVGTVALDAASKGYTVYMVTPDKDYGQVVRENVFIYKPGYKGGTFEILGEKEVCEKWGIQQVSQVIDILGLMGDAVDNIPGIPGIGEKTAAKLLAEYHTLEEVLANADHIKGALGEKVRNGKESAILSKKLATIITNVPVEFHEEDFKLKEWNKEELNTIFNELEFRTIGARILGNAPGAAGAAATTTGQTDLFGNAVITKDNGTTAPDLFTEAEQFNTIDNTPHNYHLVETEAQLNEFLAAAAQQQEICFDTETTGTDAMLAELVGLSFAWHKGEAYYIPCSTDAGEVKALLEKLRPLFDNEHIIWIGQNLKYDLLMLKGYGFGLKGKHFDTMLANYAIEPEGKRGMDMLAMKYLKYQPVSIETLIGKKGKGQGNMRDVPLDKIKEYAAEDADITLQLKEVFTPLLSETEAEDLFYQVENPLVPVLADMEFEGVGIDVNFLADYSKELGREIKEAEAKVYQLAGVEFNLASPKQLGEVLFEKMKLDEKAKKTKTGQYATGEDVLQKLRSKHEIIDSILVFREYSKLKSTYADSLPLMVNPKTGRIHTSFNQSVVVTGRLSSNNPNLQNIPIRTDRGREIRKAFVSVNEDHVLLSADYSQIELRVVAAISGDESMIQAFRDNKDIHRATAAKVYNVTEEEVTFEMRRNAKAVNFGIIYGQSAFGLAENLGISRSEAKEIIDNYFKQYASIKQYMDDSIQFAKQHGYVQTLKGRRIKLADINSSNQTVRGFAERVAINAPIQGSAADMIKLAMIRIDKMLKDAGVRARMILQVHDELVFDVPHTELEQVRALVLEGMQQAMALPNDVPVIAEAGSGHNWLDAH